jgi:hypothetical protein
MLNFIIICIDLLIKIKKNIILKRIIEIIGYVGMKNKDKLKLIKIVRKLILLYIVKK